MGSISDRCRKCKRLFWDGFLLTVATSFGVYYKKSWFLSEIQQIICCALLSCLYSLFASYVPGAPYLAVKYNGQLNQYAFLCGKGNT